MSMGGGGGGILVGVGHISILGVTDPNMIKVVNQILEFSSRVVSVPLYHRQRRLVWSVALAYGIGAPLGAICGSSLSKSYLASMAIYRPRSAFSSLSSPRASSTRAGRKLFCSTSAIARRAQRPNASARRHAHSGFASLGDEAPHTVQRTWRRIRIRFGGEDFDFSPWTTAAGGFCISLICSLFGVGRRISGHAIPGERASASHVPGRRNKPDCPDASPCDKRRTYLLLRVNVDWALVRRRYRVFWSDRFSARLSIIISMKEHSRHL